MRTLGWTLDKADLASGNAPKQMARLTQKKLKVNFSIYAYIFLVLANGRNDQIHFPRHKYFRLIGLLCVFSLILGHVTKHADDGAGKNYV
jgi:hypothetical protein